MDVRARGPRADELALVADIARSGLDELRPNRGGEIFSQWEARAVPLGDVLPDLLTRDDAEVLVGVIDDVTVGYAIVERHFLHDGRAVGHLTDLYVLPDARGVGVGEALMDEVLDWCRRHECVGVDSLALPGDRATKNFFESYGLVARALRVHRRL